MVAAARVDAHASTDIRTGVGHYAVLIGPGRNRDKMPADGFTDRVIPSAQRLGSYL